MILTRHIYDPVGLGIGPQGLFKHFRIMFLQVFGRLAFFIELHDAEVPLAVFRMDAGGRLQDDRGVA